MRQGRILPTINFIQDKTFAAIFGTKQFNNQVLRNRPRYVETKPSSRDSVENTEGKDFSGIMMIYTPDYSRKMVAREEFEIPTNVNRQGTTRRSRHRKGGPKPKHRNLKYGR